MIMANIMQTNFRGDPTLGMFGFATDKYCVIGHGMTNLKRLSETLCVPVHECAVMGTDLVGLFSTGNSSGIVVPSVLEKSEIKELEKVTKVLVLKTDFTAIGNMILINDKGCLISKLIKNQKDEIEKFFGIPCEIAKTRLGIIGSAALANNSGCVVHPNLETEMIDQIIRILGVQCSFGTANFGSPYSGACVIANSNGLVVSEESTGIEVSGIEEILFRKEQ